jgi:Ca2+-binding EF-hand superfamily protein
VNEKVSFAFELYDIDGTGSLKPPELSFILTAMNNVASYFGDPVMSSEQIEELVEDIYKDNDIQVRLIGTAATCG